ncbi:MAG: hypothetical protein K0S65_1446 [Labilithrix sp.]|nr:hypothetical protein [Labilithrix sp.]
MAAELPDPGGRARALAEANQLATELARASAPIASGDVDSDALDAAVNALLLIDTRIALLHEKLRTATARTTAVLAE